jgi:hypothetical protein
MNKQETSMLDTVPDQQNETIVAQNTGVIDFRMGLTRNSNMDTVEIPENKQPGVIVIGRNEVPHLP